MKQRKLSILMGLLMFFVFTGLSLQPASAMGKHPAKTAGSSSSMMANPCKMKHNPCSMKANPCNMKANPCSMKNPCNMKANPCNMKHNPCSMKNPCYGKGGKW